MRAVTVIACEAAAVFTLIGVNENDNSVGGVVSVDGEGEPVGVGTDVGIGVGVGTGVGTGVGRGVGTGVGTGMGVGMGVGVGVGMGVGTAVGVLLFVGGKSGCNVVDGAVVGLSVLLAAEVDAEGRAEKDGVGTGAKVPMGSWLGATDAGAVATTLAPPEALTIDSGGPGDC